MYPNKIRPANQVFVQQFVWALADKGLNCSVICPVAVNLSPALALLPERTTETTGSGATIDLYFPKFISFGQRTFAGLKTARATTELFYRAVLQVWDKLADRPEVVYGHFLTPAGICASRLSRKYQVPAFAAYGEDSPWSVYNFGKEKIKKEIADLDGIVAVSNANKDDLEALEIFPASNIQVFPNGVRANFFYPRDKVQSRERFGFDQNTFLVAFLGAFSERKGVLRLAEAADGLQGVQVAFAGKGHQQPKIANCVYDRIVKHEDLPYFLSAADVFVLPTLSEGCSNAIVEAIACGLPIISADLPFNAEILNQENAILIDPKDIGAIRRAIIYLRDNPAACSAMRSASLEKAKDLTIEKRAANILGWMEQSTEKPVLHAAPDQWKRAVV